LEQWTFWQKLQKRLTQDHFDILHVQDPILAKLAQRAYAKGKTNCKCILAHGTEEPVEFLLDLPFVQHLAPWHLQHMLQSVENKDYPGWTAIPNFVDTACFSPPNNADEQIKIRTKLNLPENALIWGTAAAIKKHHKRMDWLINEFSEAAKHHANLHLAIAGSRQKDTPMIQNLAERCCPGRVTFLENFPHESMPDFYKALDAFTLTSLFEMMPIAVLEALSSGLPVFCHDHPILQWMIGPGGKRLQMDQKGQLTDCIQQYSKVQLAETGKYAREHACELFSMPHVIQAYIEYYQKVLSLP
jgi:glycosyltransferase involved in cell wall biosynthesis